MSLKIAVFSLNIVVALVGMVTLMIGNAFNDYSEVADFNSSFIIDLLGLLFLTISAKGILLLLVNSKKVCVLICYAIQMGISTIIVGTLGCITFLISYEVIKSNKGFDRIKFRIMGIYYIFIFILLIVTIIVTGVVMFRGRKNITKVKKL